LHKVLFSRLFVLLLLLLLDLFPIVSYRLVLLDYLLSDIFVLDQVGHDEDEQDDDVTVTIVPSDAVKRDGNNGGGAIVMQRYHIR